MRARLDAAVALLSGGEQQMVAIARALLLHPELLIMDEPSTGLSPKVVRDIVGVMARLREGGMSILLVEQNVALAAETSERAYVMSLGRVVHEVRRGEWGELHQRRATAARVSGRRAPGRGGGEPMSTSLHTDVSGWATRLSQRRHRALHATRRVAQCHAGRLRHAPGRAGGQRTAVVEGERSASFGEVLAQAKRLADAFRTHGTAAGRRDLVPAAQLDRDDGASTLAACIAGLVVNPIVPIYRESEVRYILRDARAKLFFIPAALSQLRLPGHGGSACASELPHLRARGRGQRRSARMHAVRSAARIRRRALIGASSAPTPTPSSWCCTPRAPPAIPRASCTVTTPSCPRSMR